MKNRNIKKNKDSGFVLLFVVVLSSIILSIALGIADIAYKEFTFSTSAKNTNEAFFAADTGIECALYHDQSGTNSAFGRPVVIGSEPTCAGNIIDIDDPETPPISSWTFRVLELGSSNKACAIVTVVKDSTAGTTEITSKGYNVGGDDINCTSTDINRLERELVVSYSDIAPPAPTSFVLNVDVLSGTNTGGVVSDPAGAINCVSGTDDCTEEYPLDPFTLVDLNAVAQPTFVFDSWGGDCSGTDPNVCSVLMNSNKTVSANFIVNTAPSHLLSVGKIGNGDIVSSPSGINCTGSCSAGNPSSASFSVPVILTATATGGHHFGFWYTNDDSNSTGCENSTNPECTITLSGDDTINGFFGYRLTVSKNFPAAGTISSGTFGFNCGSVCTIVSTGGGMITVNNIDSNYQFDNWSGTTCNGSTSLGCIVTLNQDHNIVANFSPISGNFVPTVTTPTYASVTSSGATLGANVTSLGTPASISARGTCWGTSPAPTTNCAPEGGTTTGTFTHARTGMAPNTTYFFRGYATNTTGTGYSADGTFTTPASSYVLSVSKSGTGASTGNVFSGTSPVINCGIDCVQTYPFGTSITLQTSVAGGTTFNGWSSTDSGFSCPGTGNCTVTMDQARNVTATFTSTPVMSGTLSSSSCTIPAGSSSCNVTLTFNVTNPENPGGSSVTSDTNNSGASSPNFVITPPVTTGTVDSGTKTLVTIPYINGGVPAGRTFYLYNNGKSLVPTSPSGSGITVTATCEAGSTWNGSICANIPPVANAGPDKAITLPTSTSAPTGTSATDTPPGTVSTTVWTQVGSTPSVATITNGSTLTPSFSNLNSVGTYTFRLTVTDNNGATHTDDMQVVVSAALVMSGTLTPSSSSCTISVGASSCTSGTLTWTTTNPVSVSSVTNNGTATPSAPSGNNSSSAFTVPYNTSFSGVTTFYLYNNSVELAQATVTTTCAVGSTWNGSSCAAPSTSSITFVGSNSANNFAVILPTYQTGDLIVVFAYTSNSNTPPTIPSGWTNAWINPSSYTSGNAASVGYRIATSNGTNVSSGFWTGATAVTSIVFRGVNTTTPIGSAGGIDNASSDPVNYYFPFLSQTNGTSWVLSFAGHKSIDTNLENPPAGMINRSNIVRSSTFFNEISSHSTSSGVSSYFGGTVNVAGTPNSYITRTFELISQ